MSGETNDLKALGTTVPVRYDNPSADQLESFPNPHKDQFYTVKLESEEVSSLCPKTSQPDFCALSIVYAPKDSCVETKSLKLYLCAYRNEGLFMEDMINRILKDLVACCQPAFMHVTGRFNVRGGVGVEVRASHDQTKEMVAKALDNMLSQIPHKSEPTRHPPPGVMAAGTIIH